MSSVGPSRTTDPARCKDVNTFLSVELLTISLMILFVFEGKAPSEESNTCWNRRDRVEEWSWVFGKRVEVSPIGR